MKSGLQVISSLLGTRKRLCWLVAVVLFSVTGSVHAQNGDIDASAPIIELDELQESIADQSQVFTARVVDDKALKDVTLYHRRDGQSAYQRTLMTPLGLTEIFSATIATDPTDLRTIEYYVQARDETGNRTVSAFAFAPYSRTLLARTEILSGGNLSGGNAEAFTESGSEPVSETIEPIYKKRWFQIGLGVLAVGLLASQLDADDGEDRRIVPVTINLQ